MGDDNINHEMAIGVAVGTGVSAEVLPKGEDGVGAEAAAVAEPPAAVFHEGRRGEGDRLLRQAGETDKFEGEEDDDPAGPFPGVQGVDGRILKTGSDGADKPKAEKGALAVGALGAELGAAAGPNGVDLVDNTQGPVLGGSKAEELTGESVQRVVADPRGLGGKVSRDEEAGAAGYNSKSAGEGAPAEELGATAGTGGVDAAYNAARAALGGSESEGRAAESAPGLAADPHGDVGRVAGCGAPGAAERSGIAAGENDIRGYGVGVGAAALLAFGAAAAFGALAAQYCFSAKDYLGEPSPGLESLSPAFWAHHGRSATDTATDSLSPLIWDHHGRSATANALPRRQFPLPDSEALQPPANVEVTHQEPPHLGRGPWVHTPRAGTSTSIPSTIHGGSQSREGPDGFTFFIVSVLFVTLTAAAAALVLLE